MFSRIPKKDHSPPPPGELNNFWAPRLAGASAVPASNWAENVFTMETVHLECLRLWRTPDYGGLRFALAVEVFFAFMEL